MHAFRTIIIGLTTAVFALCLSASAFAGKPPKPVRVPQDHITIQEAINAASPGDTVLVDGTEGVNTQYFENIVIDKAITLTSVYGMAFTEINGGGLTSVVTILVDGVVIDGFTITNGTGTVNNLYFEGGGVWSYSSFTLQNSTITGNTASWGAGVFSRGANSDVVVSNCVFRDNTSTQWGSGIQFGGGTATISNCLFENNFADNSGGGISFSGGVSTISDSIFRGNTSYGGGGAVQVNGAEVHIDNCIMSNNNGTSGGALYLAGGLTTITNCTISGHRNSTSSSAIHAGGRLTLTNSILWGNVDYLGITTDLQENVAGNATVTYCNIEEEDPAYPGQGLPWPGLGNISADPLFVDPRPASSPPTAEGDYHLGDGASPCIDSADPASTYPDHDIDGDPRPPGAYDMGADEYGAQQPCGIVITEALYNYPGDTLDVKATSPLGEAAVLEVLLESYPPVAMQWKRQGSYWFTTIQALTPAPGTVSVWGPVDNCTVSE